MSTRITTSAIFIFLLNATGYTQEGKFAEINGIKMYYEIHGTGKPLLVIHGNGSSTVDVKHQTNYFSKSRMVIVADSRGHGRSSYTGKEIFTYDLLASDWAALIEKLNLEHVDVFGWSDGGIIGIILAKDHGKRIDKVYAFGANTRPAKESLMPPMYRGIMKMVTAISNSGPADSPTKFIVAMMLDYPSISWGDLAKVKRPVMVATADHDLILLEHSVKIYKSLPRSYLQVFSNANHFLPMTDPERINKSIEAFLNKSFEKIPYIMPGMEAMWVE